MCNYPVSNIQYPVEGIEMSNDIVLFFATGKESLPVGGGEK